MDPSANKPCLPPPDLEPGSLAASASPARYSIYYIYAVDQQYAAPMQQNPFVYHQYTAPVQQNTVHKHQNAALESSIGAPKSTIIDCWSQEIGFGSNKIDYWSNIILQWSLKVDSWNRDSRLLEPINPCLKPSSRLLEPHYPLMEFRNSRI